MIYLTMVCLLFSDQAVPESVSVTSGVLIVGGSEVKVGPGTFIPAPRDADLAKRIIVKNEKIAELLVRIEVCEKKAFEVFNSRTKREHDINVIWRERYNELELENILLRSWWNRWGKTALWCLVSAGAAAILSWELKAYLDRGD